MASGVTKVSLRRLGAPTGKLIKKPDSWAALLEQGSRILGDGTPAARIFIESGDEIDDLELVESGDILYVSSGADWFPPVDVVSSTSAAPDGSCSAAGAAAGVCFAESTSNLRQGALQAPEPAALAAASADSLGTTPFVLIAALAIGLALKFFRRKHAGGASSGQQPAPWEVAWKESKMEAPAPAAREEAAILKLLQGSDGAGEGGGDLDQVIE